MTKPKHKSYSRPKRESKAIKLAKVSNYQYIAGFLIVIAAIFLGYLVFIASHAASPYASSEAETGTLSGSACKVSGDSTASNSSYVSFGGPQCSSSGGGGPATLIRGMYNTPSSLVPYVTGGLDYVDGSSWSTIAGYQPPSPSNWSGQLLLSVPMDPSGQTNLNVPSNTGTFKTLAQNLVNAGWSNAILRIGWEWSGPNWFPWSGNTTAAQYVTAFDDIVTAMRSIGSSQHFLFDWCDAGTTTPVTGSGTWTQWYPGDNYVDIIGIDYYEPQGDNSSTATSDWNNSYNQTGGLGYVASFAAQHHKYVSVPEWGVDGDNDGTYIDLMSQFVHSPANNVLYESYFNQTGPCYITGDSCDDMLGDNQAACTAYIKDFGGPSGGNCQ